MKKEYLISENLIEKYRDFGINMEDSIINEPIFEDSDTYEDTYHKKTSEAWETYLDWS